MVAEDATDFAILTPRGQCSETEVRVHGCIWVLLPPVTLRLVGNLVHSFAAVCLDITINIRLMATPEKSEEVRTMNLSTACWCIDTLLIDPQYAHDVFPLSNTIAIRDLFPCIHHCYVHNQSIRQCERWTRLCVNENSKSASGRLCDGGEIRLLMCKYKDMKKRDREGLYDKIILTWHDFLFIYFFMLYVVAHFIDRLAVFQNLISYLYLIGNIVISWNHNKCVIPFRRFTKQLYKPHK